MSMPRRGRGRLRRMKFEEEVRGRWDGRTPGRAGGEDRRRRGRDEAVGRRGASRGWLRRRRLPRRRRGRPTGSVEWTICRGSPGLGQPGVVRCAARATFPRRGPVSGARPRLDRSRALDLHSLHSFRLRRSVACRGSTRMQGSVEPEPSSKASRAAEIRVWDPDPSAGPRLPEGPGVGSRGCGR